MIRDKLKKEIILSIKNKEVNDINSFLIKFTSYKEKRFEPSNTNHTHSLYGRNINYKDMFYLANDDRDIIFKLKQFISLWNKLEKLELIITVPHTEKLLPLVSSETKNTVLKDIKNITSIVKGYLDKQIIPDEDELKTFIKNKYASKEELYYLKEKKYRIASQIVAVIVAVISIVFSILNYKNNTKPREVTLRNSNLTNDTLRVILINSKELGDSLLIKEKSE